MVQAVSAAEAAVSRAGIAQAIVNDPRILLLAASAAAWLLAGREPRNLGRTRME